MTISGHSKRPVTPAVVVPTEPIRTNIGENPAEFARQLISRMNQSAGRALSLQMRGIGRTVAQATPKELWEVLGSVAADVENRAPTLLIISQDPYVTWELALLKTPIDTGSAPFLGAQTVLGRWILPPVGNDTPNPPVQEPRSIGSMRILSGVYLKERGRWRRLEHAEQEAADLASRYHGVPVVAEMPSVVDFLENPPAAEVFHFAGHAIYDPSSWENGLVLSDETYLDSTLISVAQFFPLSLARLFSSTRARPEVVTRCSAGTRGLLAPCSPPVHLRSWLLSGRSMTRLAPELSLGGMHVRSMTMCPRQRFSGDGVRDSARTSTATMLSPTLLFILRTSSSVIPACGWFVSVPESGGITCQISIRVVHQ